MTVSPSLVVRLVRMTKISPNAGTSAHPTGWAVMFMLDGEPHRGSYEPLGPVDAAERVAALRAAGFDAWATYCGERREV